MAQGQPMKFNFFESSFFVLQGIFVGIGANDLFRLLNLPGSKEPIPNMIPEVDKDELYQYIIDATVAASGLIVPLFSKPTNNLFLGIGMAVGTRWSNMTERGSSLSLLDAEKNKANEVKRVMEAKIIG